MNFPANNMTNMKLLIISKLSLAATSWEVLLNFKDRLGRVLPGAAYACSQDFYEYSRGRDYYASPGAFSQSNVEILLFWCWTPKSHEPTLLLCRGYSLRRILPWPVNRCLAQPVLVHNAEYFAYNFRGYKRFFKMAQSVWKSPCRWSWWSHVSVLEENKSIAAGFDHLPNP